MAKYSLGTDDLAGLRWMSLNSAKEILTNGGGNPKVEDVLAGAKLIETYILDQGALDQIATEAASSRAAAEQAEAQAIRDKATALEQLSKASEPVAVTYAASGGGGGGGVGPDDGAPDVSTA